MSEYDPKIIVALDFEDVAKANQLISRLSPNWCRLKIGKQMFTQQGPNWVAEVIAKGFDVFLDLKFHDIPNTVASACYEAAKLGVWMLNVHAAGGQHMMQAAKEAILNANCQTPPKLIAVTVLTSLSNADLAAVGVAGSVNEQVVRLAQLTQHCGLDGVVCSAQEAPLLREACGRDFILVTPGIRLPESPGQDQKRIVSPAQAMAGGANYLVVGRPITAAEDPMAVIDTIRYSIE